MTSPIFPRLDGPSTGAQVQPDRAAQKNWSEIEFLEREQGSGDAPAKQPCAGTTSTASLGILADSEAAMGMPLVRSADNALPLHGDERAAQKPDRTSFENAVAIGPLETRQHVETRSASHASTSSQIVPALTDASLDVAFTRAAEYWHGSADALNLTIDATAVGSSQAIAVAAAGIERSLAASGILIAAQKLQAAVRVLSPEQVSELLDKSAGPIAEMFAQAVQVWAAAHATEDRQRDARAALAIAYVAAAVDKDPRPPTSRLLQDLSAIVLASGASRNNATFSGLAQAIAIGAGARLALAVAAEMSHREEDRPRARAFVTLILAGLVSLGERVDDAYADLLKQAGPLCLEWLRWRGVGEDSAVRALVNALKGQSAYLQRLAPELERLETSGLAAFRAIRDLGAYPSDRLFRQVHEQFLASPGVFASIVGSPAALRDIQQLSLVNNGAPDLPVLEAVRLTLTQIGFDAPRAAFLADISQLGSNSLLLEGNWTELDDFEFIETQGAVFQRLLVFLNGQFVIAQNWQTIGFEDPDM